MKRITAVLALSLLAAVAAADAASAEEHVYARAAVPDEARKVGEVRLLEREGATVVETVLATRVIERVVAEIRLKEERNWPPDCEGHADMTRYTTALADAAKAIRAKVGPADARNADDPTRRARLLIDFRADAEHADVELAEFDAGDTGAPLEPTARRTLTTLPLSRVYVLRNMRLILADAFHVPESELAKLGPLGPAALP